MPNVLDSKPIITGSEIQSLITNFFDVMGPDDVIKHLTDTLESNLVPPSEIYPCGAPVYNPRVVSDLLFTHGQLCTFFVQLYITAKCRQQ